MSKISMLKSWIFHLDHQPKYEMKNILRGKLKNWQDGKCVKVEKWEFLKKGCYS
jgi:hypothetical protein